MLVIRPEMEAVFRCVPAADPRLPPVSDCAGGLPMAEEALTPASENDANVADDANVAGGAVGGK